MHACQCFLGTRDYLCPVDLRDLAEAEKYATCPDPPASLEFLELANIVVEEYHLLFPSNISEALDFYVQLITIIGEEIG